MPSITGPRPQPEKQPMPPSSCTHLAPHQATENQSTPHHAVPKQNGMYQYASDHQAPHHAATNQQAAQSAGQQPDYPNTAHPSPIHFNQHQNQHNHTRVDGENNPLEHGESNVQHADRLKTPIKSLQTRYAKNSFYRTFKEDRTAHSVDICEMCIYYTAKGWEKYNHI